MLDKEKLQAKLNQRYRNLLNDVRFHEEGLKFDFAEEVCRVMEEKGITRAELARRMGTSPAWITKMLRTNWNMTMETMAKLAFALGVKVEPHFVELRKEFTDTKPVSAWFPLSDAKISERLSKCPTRPSEDYSSDPIIKVLFVKEQGLVERKRKGKSEAFSLTA